MSDLHAVWTFTRNRLDAALDGLNDAQMDWRAHEAGHTIFEYAYHIAGAEYFWASRFEGKPAQTPFELFMDGAVFEGFLREGPCKLLPEHKNRQAMLDALRFSAEQLGPILESPSQSQLEMVLTSPVGDTVSGKTGMIRIAQHAAYHTGQIWTLRQDPGFPN